jgi:ApbE superfamily uncharacterized protein (UPF0280 family)
MGRGDEIMIALDMRAAFPHGCVERSVAGKIAQITVCRARSDAAKRQYSLRDNGSDILCVLNRRKSGASYVGQIANTTLCVIGHTDVSTDGLRGR